jgi:hypothetical protein
VRHRLDGLFIIKPQCSARPYPLESFARAEKAKEPLSPMRREKPTRGSAKTHTCYREKAIAFRAALVPRIWRKLARARKNKGSDDTRSIRKSFLDQCRLPVMCHRRKRPPETTGNASTHSDLEVIPSPPLPPFRLLPPQNIKGRYSFQSIRDVTLYHRHITYKLNVRDLI